MRGVADEIDENASHEHFYYPFPRFQCFRHRVFLSPIVSTPDNTTPVKLLGARKQMFPYHGVADDLKDHGDEVKKRELHVLERDEIHRVVARETQTTVLLNGDGVRLLAFVWVRCFNFGK